jgi:hypothetical protein
MRTAFCHICHDRIALTEDGQFVQHTLSDRSTCEGWGQEPLTDPGKVLSILADSLPSTLDDAGFWILLSASGHLFGDHESEDGSTAAALFWNTEPVLTVEGSCN